MASKDLVVHYLVHGKIDGEATPISGRRLGLAVSKAVGNAVVRNTVKRRFRVLAHRYEHELPADCDIVLRAKPGAAHASFQSLEAQIQALFRAVMPSTCSLHHWPLVLNDSGFQRSWELRWQLCFV